MLPTNVHVAPEAKKHTIGLGKVNFAAIFGVQEGQFTRAPKRNADRDVLVFGTLQKEEWERSQAWLGGDAKGGKTGPWG
jgi:hypothetical protein